MTTSLSEFHVIERYFAHLTPNPEDVVLGIGDDCALLQPSQDQLLAVSMDTLVVGRHFLPDVDPESLGHKVLAVSLSDLAAMGATPAWATLALTLSEVDPEWLQAFAKGFSALASQHHVTLVGGDTTRGQLSITVQVHGFVKGAQALRRGGAAPDELIYVTGMLGDAALALQFADIDPDTRSRLHWPQPRIAQGQAIAGLARSAIDISDGLLADLGHVCTASHLGATIQCELLPLSAAVKSYTEQTGDWSLPLAGGDDYELCFTIPRNNQQQLESLFEKNGWTLTRIGKTRKEKGVDVCLEDGSLYHPSITGFDHFANDP